VEHRISFVYLLHPKLCIFLLANVRMIFASVLSIRFFDLFGSRGIGYVQNLIVILEFHGGAPGTTMTSIMHPVAVTVC
jgi:hypothetical protein